jgi:phosphatidylglycerophosphatase A
MVIGMVIALVGTAHGRSRSPSRSSRSCREFLVTGMRTVAASKGVDRRRQQRRQVEDHHPADRPRASSSAAPMVVSRLGRLLPVPLGRRSRPGFDELVGPEARPQWIFYRSAPCSGRLVGLPLHRAVHSKLVFADEGGTDEAGAARSWPRSLPTETVVGCGDAGTPGPAACSPRAPGERSAAGVLLLSSCASTCTWGSRATWSLSAIGACTSRSAFCGEAEVRLGPASDPGEVILDEFVAMPLCFLGFPQLELAAAAPPCPDRRRSWVAGFALFPLLRHTQTPRASTRLQELPGRLGRRAGRHGGRACHLRHAPPRRTPSGSLG